MPKDLQKEVNSRKVGFPIFIVRFIYWIIYKFTCSKMNIEYKIIDDPKKETRPCIILQNHLSRYDHYVINGALFPKKFTYMVAYNEFFEKDKDFS